MKELQTAVIVGAGTGGFATAIFLAQKGFKVNVFEQSDAAVLSATGTGLTWEKKYHLTKGSVFGIISHLILQMGYFRPPNRHRRYHNLYFTGGSTHPGNGVPLVLMSAQLTSERIFEDMQNESSGS